MLGFDPAPPAARGPLEAVAGTFVEGYHAAIVSGDPDRLGPELASVPPAMMGFAVEGAAMGYGILDAVTPWRRDRFQRLLAGRRDKHLYLVLAGVGLALARLRRPVGPFLKRLEPELMRWLVVDGYGFHEAFFRLRRAVREHRVPRHATGYAARAFDHGVGRALWFITGASPARLREVMDGFAPERHADLWSGVALACAFAGGADEPVMRELRSAVGSHAPSLALGAALAAAARSRAGNAADHTELACRILCGRSSDEAAELVRSVESDPPLEDAEGPDVPAYEALRRQIQSVLAKEMWN